MRAAPRVRVLVEVRAVEQREGPVVAREVRGHPVEEDSDSVAMKAVDEAAEVVRRAESRRRREVTRHLVAPRAGKWMLHPGHQLDVREAEVRDVVGELIRELEIVERPVAVSRIAPPRAEMHLV